ncbi:hypothetical protein [Xanthomonas prunicola]|uniref:hypothetical protein n=1 Tax=Xanthomonas prunicola TaxID=2053930 RepID=UPI0010563648|nr:hypothetical protein [Xanthomonas prunicola]
MAQQPEQTRGARRVPAVPAWWLHHRFFGWFTHSNKPRNWRNTHHSYIQLRARTSHRFERCRVSAAIASLLQETGRCIRCRIVLAFFKTAGRHGDDVMPLAANTSIRRKIDSAAKRTPQLQKHDAICRNFCAAYQS